MLHRPPPRHAADPPGLVVLTGAAESFHYSIGLGPVIDTLLRTAETKVVLRHAEKKKWTVRFDSQAEHESAVEQVSDFIIECFNNG